MTCLTAILTCNDVLVRHKTGKKNENINLDAKRILVVCKEISSFNTSWSKITAVQGYYIVRLGKDQSTNLSGIDLYHYYSWF